MQAEAGFVLKPIKDAFDALSIATQSLSFQERKWQTSSRNTLLYLRWGDPPLEPTGVPGTTID